MSNTVIISTVGLGDQASVYPGIIDPYSTVISEFVEWIEERAGRVYLISDFNPARSSVDITVIADLRYTEVLAEFYLTWPSPGEILKHPDYWKRR